jgi:hypothetical protein
MLQLNPNTKHIETPQSKQASHLHQHTNKKQHNIFQIAEPRTYVNKPQAQEHE